VSAPAGLAPISLGLGEPQHPTPQLIKQAVTANLAGLSRYPATAGQPELRDAIAAWITRRFGLKPLDPATQVLPVNGSKEALFSLVQAALDPDERDALVICPNPFYQIYEGATLLGGARPWFINSLAANGLKPDWGSIPDEVWAKARLAIVCSPSNPHGRVMTLEEWKLLFDLSDKHGFLIVADECYSEIYFDEATPARWPRPLRSAATATRASYRFRPCRSGRARRGCAPGSSRAIARCSRASSFTAPITARP
jgi:N-succinyldiaminopimelate aminotransferase